MPASIVMGPVKTRFPQLRVEGAVSLMRAPAPAMFSAWLAEVEYRRVPPALMVTPWVWVEAPPKTTVPALMVVPE